MLPRNLPSDISQKRLARAFEKAGFILNMKGGKGGHYKMKNPKNGKFIILQGNIYKKILENKLKQAEEWGYNAEEIMENY